MKTKSFLFLFLLLIKGLPFYELNSPVAIAVSELLPTRAFHGDKIAFRVDRFDEVFVGSNVVAADHPTFKYIKKLNRR